MNLQSLNRLKINNKKSCLTRAVFFITLVLANACGPSAEQVSAPTGSLKTEPTVFTFEQNPEVDTYPAIFSFFVWPSEKEMITLNQEFGFTRPEDVGAAVGDLSTQLDQIYYERARVLKELEATNKFIAEATAKYVREQLYMTYACIADESNPDRCLRLATDSDPVNLKKIPSQCSDLKRVPWRSLFKPADSKDCASKKNETEENFNRENPELTEKLNYLTKREAELSNSTISLMAKIPPVVNGKNDLFDNWIFTENTKSSITYDFGSTLAPKIILTFRLKNELVPDRLNTQQNLTYQSHPEKSSSDLANPIDDIDTVPSIIDVRLVMDKNAPTLKFRILEKNSFLVNGSSEKYSSAFTGRYYDVSLERSVQTFGLLYLGDVDYYDQNGKLLNEGIMKLIFPFKK